MPQPKSVASQIWPHLAHGTPNEVEGRRARNAAEGCWPSLSREQKAKEAAQAWEREWVRKEQRASNARTVELLRQMNERLARGAR
jgi:hypothetical protein